MVVWLLYELKPGRAGGDAAGDRGEEVVATVMGWRRPDVKEEVGEGSREATRKEERVTVVTLTGDEDGWW